MAIEPRAILFGKDDMLNLTRRWILERAGFVVHTAQRASEVDSLLQQYAVDLLVFCYSTTEQDCLQIVTAIEGAGHGLSGLWLGRHDANRPAYLPQDVVAMTSDPHELYLAALQSLSRIAAARA